MVISIGNSNAFTCQILDMSLSSWLTFESYSSPMGTFCSGRDHFAPDPESVCMSSWFTTKVLCIITIYLKSKIEI